MKIKILLITVCLGLFATGVAAQDLFPFVGRVNSNEVNVRAGQSSNFEKLITLGFDEEVLVVEKSFSWYKIRLPWRAKAYINKEFVKIIDPEKGEGIVIGSRVNIRAGAGTKYSILGQADAGQEIHVVTQSEEWLQIEPFEDLHGWISVKYIDYQDADVDGLMAQIEEERIAVRQPQVPAKPVIYDGTIKPVSSTGYDSIAYLLYVNDKPKCYVQGIKQILEPFVDHVIQIEGMVNNDFSDTLSLPVLSVARIEYIL